MVSDFITGPWAVLPLRSSLIRTSVDVSRASTATARASPEKNLYCDPPMLKSVLGEPSSVRHRFLSSSSDRTKLPQVGKVFSILPRLLVPCVFDYSRSMVTLAVHSLILSDLDIPLPIEDSANILNISKPGDVNIIDNWARRVSETRGSVLSRSPLEM